MEPIGNRFAVMPIATLISMECFELYDDAIASHNGCCYNKLILKFRFLHLSSHHHHLHTSFTTIVITIALPTKEHHNHNTKYAKQQYIFKFN